MSYSDDLFDQTPAPQREGFTNYRHWKVVQTGQGGTTNWFASHSEAVFFKVDHGGILIGVTCEEFESAWPWPRPHLHGASPDGERQEATEPTPQADARRSQRLGRLI